MMLIRFPGAVDWYYANHVFRDVVAACDGKTDDAVRHTLFVGGAHGFLDIDEMDHIEAASIMHAISGAARRLRETRAEERDSYLRAIDELILLADKTRAT